MAEIRKADKGNTEREEKMLGELLDMEWQMFTSVKDVSGRAACQDDKKTFTIMRLSQFLVWDAATLESYYEDVKRAAESGHNLMTEKYARMMERTWPEEYEKLLPYLEPVPAEKLILVREILTRQMVMLGQLEGKYPRTVRRGRPLYSSEDTGADTSTETYLYGELQTYSLETLRRYDQYMDELQKEGRSLNEEILKITAGFYGFSGLAQAEAVS